MADGAVGLVAAAASGLVTFAALVALGPVMMSGLAATVGRLVTAVGRAPGRMAVANAAQVPRRTAATVTVLTLGVGLTSALLVGVASADSSAQRSISQRLPSAVQVSAPTRTRRWRGWPPSRRCGCGRTATRSSSTRPRVSTTRPCAPRSGTRWARDPRRSSSTPPTCGPTRRRSWGCSAGSGWAWSG
ncbi:hypothetical protein ACFQV8_05470 [Pseudonocardia benzenivorans]